MSKIDDGGPAFPFAEEMIGSVGQQYIQQWVGLSVRDFFAAQAFGSMMGHAENLGSLSKEARAALFGSACAVVYEAADAMISARKGDAS